MPFASAMVACSLETNMVGWCHQIAQDFFGVGRTAFGEINLGQGKACQRGVILVAGVGRFLKQLFGLRHLALVGSNRAQVVLGDGALQLEPGYLAARSLNALVTAARLASSVGKLSQGAGIWRPDGRFLHLNGVGQSLLAHRVLVAHVEINADGEHGDGDGDRAVEHQLTPMFGDKIDRLFDFKRELVGLQLFSRDSSGHKNLRRDKRDTCHMVTRPRNRQAGRRSVTTRREAAGSASRPVIYSPSARLRDAGLHKISRKNG